MPPTLVAYIIHHGYGIIFLLVFLQEIGIPNPVPNELILMYSGYLASAGHFSAWLIVLTAVSADFIGTSVLYGIFYLFGLWIVTKRPRWIPVERIEAWKEKISKRGKWGIFLGRHLPYIRGYTSAAAGLLDIPAKIFLPIVLCSAITWSGGLVFLGSRLGIHVEEFATKFGSKIIWVGIIVGLLVGIFVLPKLFAKKQAK